MTCVADPLTNGGEVSLTTSISRVVLQVMSLSLSFPSEMLPPSVLKFDLVFLSTIKGSSHRHPAPEMPRSGMQGITMHYFPSEESLWQKWILFVRIYQKDGHNTLNGQKSCGIKGSS